MMKAALRVAALVLGAVACVVPSGSSTSAEATRLCAGPGLVVARGMGGTAVAGGFASTASDAVKWAAAGRSHVMTAPLENLAGTTLVAFCYIDGDFSGMPQPPGGNVAYIRALFLVPASGDPFLYEAGPRDSIAVVPPNRAAP
jgi:hypothetical protein